MPSAVASSVATTADEDAVAERLADLLLVAERSASCRSVNPRQTMFDFAESLNENTIV